MHLGHLAAICLSRAIARGVYHATPVAPDDPRPTYRDRFG
jgi:L-aminopeptidase/D-esterase-like protein